jgi:hypothetical protein
MRTACVITSGSVASVPLFHGDQPTYETEPLSSIKDYQDCQRTGQRFRTPCAGLDYNMLRLNTLHRIIFGQPRRSTIIQLAGGQVNNNLGLEYSKKIKRAWIYSRFSRQNDLYAILVPRRPGSAYGLCLAF